MRIHHTIDIEAPVSRVWNITIDVESYPEHTSTITSVDRVDNGPLEVGSCARIKQPGQRAKVWRVTKLDHQSLFAWSTKAMGTVMTGSHVLEPTESGTRNTLAIDIEGRLAPVVGALIRSPIKKAIIKENEGIKAAAMATRAASTRMSRESG